MQSLGVKTFLPVGVCGGILLFCALPLGCGGQSESRQREESALKPLALFYGQFTGRHQGQPPASEAEFKEFVRSLSSEALARFNITDPESLFVSSRDGQPYVVIYGPSSGPPGPAGSPVIAYEQVGVRGKRFVASSLGAVEEVDEARFKELVPNAP